MNSAIQRTRLTIDWMALEDALETNLPEVKCYFNVQTGEILQVVEAEEDYLEKKARASSDAFVLVDPFPSRLQYQWMEQFIEATHEPAVSAALQGAINGKGAFRRFKDVLRRFAEERKRWFEFRDDLIRGEVEDWLEARGIEAINAPPWHHGEVRFIHNHHYFLNPRVREERLVRQLRVQVETWAKDVLETDALGPQQAEVLARELLANFEIRGRRRKDGETLEEEDDQDDFTEEEIAAMQEEQRVS